MTRRASLPGVDELFRSSRSAPPETNSDATSEETSPQVGKSPAHRPDATASEPPRSEPAARSGPSPAPEGGHVAAGAAPQRQAPRHDEKVTFYCTASDLNRIERARLALRAEHKLASDRGRIVRAALAEILDDFEQQGADSVLVMRLRNRGSGVDES